MQIAFINPPHAEWSLANNLTYLLVQSHYNHKGKYPNEVRFLPAPYMWNKYKTYTEVIEEVISADVIMFSSYAWNYTTLDNIAKQIKENYPEKLLVLGGPHIGTNDPELLDSRSFYDYICEPTKPGETFMEDLINGFIEGNLNPENISWELRNGKGKAHDLETETYSVYEEHIEYLSKMSSYAKQNDMEVFVSLETTRGCPYRCVFCEWGGGIGTKIYKKNVDIVKRDIDALQQAGFNSAYLTDANWGVFEDRDIEILNYAWKNNFILSDISTVKAKSLKRRKRLIDRFFETTGVLEETKNKTNWSEIENSNLVPNVSLQSISEKAMEVADRVDLTTENKLELIEYIKDKCIENNFTVPALEMILAMPGSTLNDFYNEMEIYNKFKSCEQVRYDYMFLPDSKLSSKKYKDQYNIKTAKVYYKNFEENVEQTRSPLYSEKFYFDTICSCDSFTEEEMYEMFFMNYAGSYVLKHWYSQFNTLSPAEFTRTVYGIVKKLPDFYPIDKEIRDIFNPDTEPRCIDELGGKNRIDTISDFLDKNRLIIFSWMLLL